MIERPDIILVMTDQQRFDQVGYASGGGYRTPNLDALAARGVVFDRAYSASTTCVPARVALMTGVQPHRAPTQQNLYALEEGFWTVAHALRAAGYDTALIGKMHFAPIHGRHGFDTMRTAEHLGGDDLVPGRPPGPDGFDDFHSWLVEHGGSDWRADRHGPTRRDDGTIESRFPYDESHHPTAWVEREATAFLDQRQSSRPLFLVVSFLHPHPPLVPLARYEQRYDPADVVLPTDGFEANDGLPLAFLDALKVQSGPYKPSRPASERALREALTATRALVEHIDDAMGEILRRVDASRSVVFFTSDHGDYAGHRGMLRKVPWIPFDDLARVPLVVAAPDATGGRHVPDLVQSSDFALTCLDYAGVDPGAPIAEFDSRSLRPWLVDQPGPDDLDRTILCATNAGWPTIRRGPLKYITRRHFTLPGQALFDLDRDPGETTDLLGHPDYVDAADELAQRLDERMWRGMAVLPRFD